MALQSRKVFEAFKRRAPGNESSESWSYNLKLTWYVMVQKTKTNYAHSSALPKATLRYLRHRPCHGNIRHLRKRANIAQNTVFVKEKPKSDEIRERRLHNWKQTVLWLPLYCARDKPNFTAEIVSLIYPQMLTWMSPSNQDGNVLCLVYLKYCRYSLQTRKLVS